MTASWTLEIGEYVYKVFTFVFWPTIIGKQPTFTMSIGLVSTFMEFPTRNCVITDAIGNVGHNPIEYERIGAIGFGIG